MKDLPHWPRNYKIVFPPLLAILHVWHLIKGVHHHINSSLNHLKHWFSATTPISYGWSLLLTFRAQPWRSQTLCLTQLYVNSIHRYGGEGGESEGREGRVGPRHRGQEYMGKEMREEDTRKRVTKGGMGRKESKKRRGRKEKGRKRFGEERGRNGR